MDLDAPVTTLKTLSVIVTGVLGILGVLGKFKRKDGSVNNWGYASMSLILISVIVSSSTTLLEAQKGKEQTLDQLSRMEGLLKEISRVGQPITHLKVTYWAELSK